MYIYIYLYLTYNNNIYIYEPTNELWYCKVKHPKVHPVKHPSIHPLSPSLADAISSGCSIDFTESSQKPHRREPAGSWMILQRSDGFDMTRRSSQLSDRTPIQVTKCKFYPVILLNQLTTTIFLATAGVPNSHPNQHSTQAWRLQLSSVTKKLQPDVGMSNPW